MAEVERERAAAVAPVIYVALGDSTGVGVGARNGGGYVARLFQRIERVRPASRLTNLCVSGATTADVLRSQVANVGAPRPTLVTLGIGINDVSRDITPEQFARNYEEIIKRIRQQTDAAIVVTNIPDISFGVSPSSSAMKPDAASISSTVKSTKSSRVTNSCSSIPTGRATKSFPRIPNISLRMASILQMKATNFGLLRCGRP